MKKFLIRILAIVSISVSMPHLSAEDPLIPGMNSYVAARVTEFSKIPSDRKEMLQDISDYVSQRLSDGQSARLTFVCTHNSRRSHFAQLWAQAAATYYKLDGVETFSGGTEATAFNPRSVAALKRAGFEIIEAADSGVNPHYTVRFSKTGQPIDCFSKVYDSPPNPAKDFCAVMTCSEADRACPSARGSDRRVAIPYVDPKVADNTPQEAETYDERCAQIAREMLYVMSRVVHKQ